MACLMLYDLVSQAFMHRLRDLHAAGPLQCVRQRGFKRIPLLSGRQWRFGVEHSVDELLVELVGLFGVKQGVIEISRTVIEGGEQEAKLRRGHDLTGCAAVELIFSGKKTELRLSVLDRTDTADDIGKHGVGDLPASRRLCPYREHHRHHRTSRADSCRHPCRATR